MLLHIKRGLPSLHEGPACCLHSLLHGTELDLQCQPIQVVGQLARKRLYHGARCSSSRVMSGCTSSEAHPGLIQLGTLVCMVTMSLVRQEGHIVVLVQLLLTLLPPIHIPAAQAERL